MRPGHIPDEHVWPGAKLVIFEAPEGHDQELLEILPVSGLVDKAKDNIDRVHIRIEVDQLDLDMLKKNGYFWLVFYGGVQPFDVAHPEVDDLLDVERDGG